MTTVKLSQAFIDHQLVPLVGKARTEYCDADLPGLYILVGSNGKVSTYFLRYKNSSGKTCHQKLGRTSDIDLAEARRKARLFKAEISLGADPRADQRAKKAIPSLSSFYNDQLLPYIKPRKRSWKRDAELFRRIEKAIGGGTRLDQISRIKVQTFHAGLLDEGLSHSTADLHLKFLRAALNHAVRWSLIDKNPIAGITLFNRDNRLENLLSEEELSRLMHVLHTDANRQICQLCELLLATGCRLNEILSAKWAAVDVDNRVLRIEAINSKSKKIRSVPLGDSAIAVISALKTKDKFDYLFVNPKTKLPYTTIMKVWDRLRIKANLPKLRIHDLRHQFASLLVNGGRSLYEVQQILGHSDPKVTQRYSHLSTKSLQAAANSASIAMKLAVSNTAA